MLTVNSSLKLGGILLTVVVLASSSLAEDEAVAKIGISSGGQAKMSPFGTSLSDPSASGITTQSVNLYTGQHVESFPLLSIAGRGGLGVDLSLDYNGNVSRMAKSENRKVQASPFGLGFSMGLISIVADHKSTADIEDDEYRLIFNELQAKLYNTDGNLYVTEDAKPWVIRRDTATISGRMCVIGWTVTAEDGTVYRLGDHDTDLSGWNATRSLLRYGNFVGNGRTQDDTLHAIQWDLRRIQDPDSLNWIDFTYTWDTRNLKVRNAAGTSVVNSLNSYTGASYPDKIETADGAEIDFQYTSRDDKQSFHGGYQYEFYANRRIDCIKVKDKNGNTVSQTRFSFSYLNPAGDSTFKKLVLREITAESADETMALGRYLFDYHIDGSSPTFGAMRRITCGSGAFKEIHYGHASSASNFTQLDCRILDYDYGYDGWQRLYAAENIFVNPRESGYWVAGIWNGYWDTITFSASTDIDDRPAISPDGWIAAPLSGDNIVILRWRSGTWVVDTLSNAIDRWVDVKLFEAPDGFLAVSGEYTDWGISCGKMMRIDSVKYFRWDDDSWNSHPVYNGQSSGDEGSYLRCVRTRNSFFAFSYLHDMENCGADGDIFLYACKYVEAGDSLVIDGSIRSVDMPGSWGRGVFVGHDYVGLEGLDSVYWAQWDGSTWAIDRMGPNFGSYWGTGHGLCELDNGFIVNWTLEAGYKASHMDTWLVDGDDFTRIFEMYGDPGWNNGVPYIWGSNHALMTSNGFTHDLIQWKWSGVQFVEDTLIYDNEPSPHKKTLYISDDHWARGPMRDSSNCAIITRRHMGHGLWSSMQTLNTSGYSYDGFVASDNFIVYRADDSTYRCAISKPFYFGDSLHCIEIPRDIVTDEESLFKCGQSTFYRLLYDRRVPFGEQTHATYAYKLADTLACGEAPLPVVDSIVTYKSPLDNSPVVQDFAYYGGILDQSATTPRFARVKATTPYFSGDSPDGYSVHFFYNDVDSAEFYNDTIFDSIPRALLNLNNDSRFGLKNGGFFLDGTEYLSYTYSVGDAASKMQDSSLSYYSVYAPISSLPEVRRICLDSTHIRKDSLCSDVSFVYDTATGFLRESWKKYKDDSTYFVESREYAYESDTAMENDNALSQVSLTKSQYIVRNGDNDTTLYDSIIKMSGSEYGLQGSWQPVQTYTWRDFESLIDTLITSDVLPTGRSFDAYGNRVVSIDASGDTSGVKLDPDGLRPMATIGKAFPDNCAFFDAEFSFSAQGVSHDGWIRDTIGGLCYNTDTSSFTGDSSLKVNDNPNSTSYNMALRRVLDADSLVRDVYLLDAWALSNGITTAIVWEYSGGLGAVVVDSACLSGDGENWMQHRLAVDLSDVQGLDSMGVAILLENTSNAYAYIDNVRFHPVDASVTTSVYDQSTGLVTASLGLSNIPVRYESDKLLRPKVTLDYAADTLSRADYFYIDVWSPDSLGAVAESPSWEPLFDTLVVAGPTTISYTLSIDDNRVSASGLARISRNGTAMDSIACTGSCNDERLGEFDVASGDIVVVSSSPGSPSSDSSWNYTAKAYFCDYLYDPDSPHYVERTTFETDGIKKIGAVFYDGAGRAVQSRTRDSLGGMEVSIVTGATEYDARGRSVKSYKTYIDTLGSNGIGDFSPWDSLILEVRGYYDQDFCPDCDTFVYSENAYAPNLKSPLDSSGAPGTSFNMASGKVTKHERYTDRTNEIYVSRTFAPDGRETRSYKDHWSESDSRITYYEDGQATDSLVTTSNSPIAEKYSEQVIDTGSGEIPLRQTFNNDLGQTDSTWKVDYGKIRMIYDNSGNVRFMMNDQRKAEANFVYFKYDNHGRKIEEGLEYGLANFTQQKALDREFPRTGDSPNVKYRWYYDYHVVDSDILLAPGMLVRVENADSSYYRNYFYFPKDRSDSTVVKLPFTNGGSLKAIVHRYNLDGSKKELVVYPNLTDSTTRRGFLYDYDAAGRLRSVSRNTGVDFHNSSLVYGQFSYNADGSLRQANLGKHCDTGSFIQQLDYRYDALGRLVAINDTSNIASSTSVVGAANDHFGQQVVYDSNSPDLIDASYFAYSTSSGKAVFSYDYDYNDLGWLTEAMADSLGDSASQRFSYNALGQREEMVVGNTLSLTEYTYNSDTAEPGSSKLLWFTDMGNDTLGYDMLGNLVDDGSRYLDTMHYDYRNLLRYVYMPSTGVDSLHDVMRFEYNEFGFRIKKAHHYWKHLLNGAYCPPVTDSVMEGYDPYGMMMMAMVPPRDSIPDLPGDDWCPTAYHAEKLYLYDGDVLLATYDQDDDVEEVFVYGPTGRMASYWENNDDRLYFSLNDNLGSPRAIVDSTGQTQYYVYHPFGEVRYSAGNHGTQYQFTGKERDEHGHFEFDYFGARYYDPRIGSFSSIDKAGQFASGYVYGANNPLIGTDPDGNLFFLSTAFLVGSYFSAGSYVINSEMEGDFSWTKLLAHSVLGGFSGYMAQGGMSGNLLGNISKSVTQSAATTLGHNAIDGKTGGEGLGLSIGSGIVEGVLSSQHWDNLKRGKGFRSYDSQVGRYLNHINAAGNLAPQGGLAMAYLEELGLDLKGMTWGGHVATKGYVAYVDENGVLTTGSEMFENSKYVGGNFFESCIADHETVHQVDFHGPDATKYRNHAYQLKTTPKQYDAIRRGHFRDLELHAYNAQMGSVRRSGLAPKWVNKLRSAANSKLPIGVQVQRPPFLYQWTQPRPWSSSVFQMYY